MKTFIDAGVLITGWRSQSASRLKALTILSDPQRQFVSSPYVKLEVLPKAQYFKNTTEEEFYREYFDGVSEWVEDCDLITQEALVVARQFGLAALDAMHIAAALLAKADEFVTAERLTSPFSRVTGIKLRFIA